MKEKIKHLPFNLFWCVSSFILPFYILSEFTQINIFTSIGLAFYLYFLDVKQQTNFDYLQEKINKIEDDKKKELTNLK